MENDSQVYVRFKRQKQTYFFKCTQYEQIDSLKRKLGSFFKGVEPGDIRLYLGPKLLDEKSNVHDQGITNNALIYFKLRKANTVEWQQIPELSI